MRNSMLRVHEVFYSLQGEAQTVGRPTVFIRLTGCPLRCSWCDTSYAFSGGSLQDIDTLMATVATYATPWVCVTGGEPLAQPECRELLFQLAEVGYKVSLETSGALSIANMDSRVSIVMDIKAPGSGESHRNLQDNLDYLRPQDQIKFVIASQLDFNWACLHAKEHKLFMRVEEVLISPVWHSVDPAELADWVLDSHLPWRFQLQLHKLLWNDIPGR